MAIKRYNISMVEHGTGEWMRADEVLAPTRKPVTVSATVDRKLAPDQVVCEVELVVGGRHWAGEATMVRSGWRYDRHPAGLSGGLLAAVTEHPEAQLLNLIESACRSACAS